MVKKAEVILTYQDLLSHPPVSPADLHRQSCTNDEVTIKAWHKQWVKQTKANKAKFGSFADHGIGKLFGRHQNLPIIIAGAGPSLKGNGWRLKERRGIPLVSCLHNFHYLEDMDCPADYYVSLDAGAVTIEEVSEGGSRPAAEYWELTKGRKLLCHTATHPELLDKWQGEVYFFTCPLPDLAVETELKAIENFNQAISSGGNVLGACLYTAKGWFGGSDIVFVGADFCFSYDHKFHPWDSKYDASLGHCVRMTDIYGNSRLSWQSYANFKAWFDSISLRVPGLFINATEGGCMGAYPGGNLASFRYMDLEDVFKMYHLNDHIRNQAEQPDNDKNLAILF